MIVNASVSINLNVSSSLGMIPYMNISIMVGLHLNVHAYEACGSEARQHV